MWQLNSQFRVEKAERSNYVNSSWFVDSFPATPKITLDFIARMGTKSTPFFMRPNKLKMVERAGVLGSFDNLWTCRWEKLFLHTAHGRNASELLATEENVVNKSISRNTKTKGCDEIGQRLFFSFAQEKLEYKHLFRTLPLSWSWNSNWTMLEDNFLFSFFSIWNKPEQQLPFVSI